MAEVLIEASCECATGIIERGCGRENDNALVALSFVDTATVFIRSIRA